MSKTSMRLKLCKMLLKFASIETNNGTLYFEGELVEGTEVYVEDENGEMVAAPNGYYIFENTTITVEEGKVTAIAVNEPVTEEVVMEDETTTIETEPQANYDEAILAIANEIELIKTEIQNIKNEIEGIKAEATNTSIEEEFGKQNKKNKPSWDKFND